MKLRSLLFVPADSERKFAKADGIGADALILDLEDSVAPGRKAFARGAVKDLLGGGPRNWSFLVRINPFGTGLTLEDLAAVVRPGLDGLLIPKVNGIEDVDLVSHYVDVLEVATGIPPGDVKLLVVATETPAAMIGFNGYARKNERLVAMTWGGRPERGPGRAHEQGGGRQLDLPLPGGARAMPVRRGCSRRRRAGYALCGLQGSGWPRRKLPAGAPRRFRRPRRDPPGSSRDHQYLFHALRCRSRACTSRRRGVCRGA